MEPLEHEGSGGKVRGWGQRSSRMRDRVDRMRSLTASKGVEDTKRDDQVPWFCDKCAGDQTASSDEQADDLSLPHPPRVRCEHPSG